MGKIGVAATGGNEEREGGEGGGGDPGRGEERACTREVAPFFSKFFFFLKWSARLEGDREGERERAGERADPLGNWRHLPLLAGQPVPTLASAESGARCIAKAQECLSSLINIAPRFPLNLINVHACLQI